MKKKPTRCTIQINLLFQVSSICIRIWQESRVLCFQDLRTFETTSMKMTNKMHYVD